MEKNTVLLSLEDYNHLRDFKNNTQKGMTTIRTSNWSSDTYLTTNEGIIELGDKYQKLMDHVEELREKVNKRTSKKMAKSISLWQFIKLKWTSWNP